MALSLWMGGYFNGHLGFLRYKGSLYKFGTYTGSRVSGSWTDGCLEVQIRNKQRTLLLKLDFKGSGGSLDAPIHGAMNREIVELPHSSLTASLRAGGKVLWEGRSEPASAEIVGDLSELF